MTLVRVSKTALYPLVTWGFSWDPYGSKISLVAGRNTVVNAQLEVQQHAGPILVEIMHERECRKNKEESEYEWIRQDVEESSMAVQLYFIMLKISLEAA